MPINILDANGNTVPVGSASVSGQEHQSAHLRFGSTAQATTVEDTSPLPVGLRALISAAWSALHAIVTGSKNALVVAVVDASGNQVTAFGGTPATVLPFHDVLGSAGTGAVRLKSGAGKLRSVYVTPASDEDGGIYIVAHDSNSNPPTSGETRLGKWGIKAGEPTEYVFPGGGISFTAGLGLRVVKNAALTDNNNVNAGTLYGATYE